MKTLTLHELEGWFYTASVDGGRWFALGYYDVDDWCKENGIDEVINNADGEPSEN